MGRHTAPHNHRTVTQGRGKQALGVGELGSTSVHKEKWPSQSFPKCQQRPTYLNTPHMCFHNTLLASYQFCLH